MSVWDSAIHSLTKRINLVTLLVVPAQAIAIVFNLCLVIGSLRFDRVKINGCLRAHARLVILKYLRLLLILFELLGFLLSRESILQCLHLIFNTPDLKICWLGDIIIESKWIHNVVINVEIYFLRPDVAAVRVFPDLRVQLTLYASEIRSKAQE